MNSLFSGLSTLFSITLLWLFHIVSTRGIFVKMEIFEQFIAPWLLVLIFVIHDGEEILAFHGWIQKNAPLFDDLERRFPLSAKPIHFIRQNTRKQFAFSVISLLVLIITATALKTLQPRNTGFQYFFVGLTSVYTLHFLIHGLQSLVVRKFVPGTITSILMMPVGLFLWQHQVRAANLTPGQSILALCIGLAVFLPAFFLAHRFGHWAGKTPLKEPPN